MSEVLAAAREKGVPVAFTRVEYDSADGTDAPLFFKKVPSLKFLEAGSPLGQIAGRIAPRADETVFAKKYASAFFGTTLATWLANNRVDTVLITGFSTSGCVRASALDTLQHGFRPIVVREACADREGGPHEANLFDLDAKYADVVALSDALEYLRSL
jgi:maleamate amidohydrolase